MPRAAFTEPEPSTDNPPVQMKWIWRKGPKKDDVIREALLKGAELAVGHEIPHDEGFSADPPELFTTLQIGHRDPLGDRQAKHFSGLRHL